MTVTLDQSKEQFLLGILRILNRAIQVPWHEVIGYLSERFPRTRFLIAQASQGASGEVDEWDGWDSAALGRSHSAVSGTEEGPAIYDDHLATHDPLLRARGIGPGVFRIETLGTPSELERSEARTRILQPGGYEHGVVLYLGTDRMIDGVIQCWRPSPTGPWRAEEIDELKLLVEPLCDAIARDRDHHAALSDQMTTLLDALESGAMCVDQRGQILHSNPKTPLTVREAEGDGSGTPVALPQELEQNVVSFLSTQVKERVRQLDLQLASDRVNCVIHRLSGFRAKHPAALVLFPSGPQQNRIAELRQQYGLTPRESDVLVAVIRGHRNAEIAKTLNLSEYTVKGHLKRIFQKLGVRSRSGAVAKVMGLDVLMEEANA